jgi:pyruvate/2-oxoglutarate dehydrogenase complex dihydrolipoamide acyltransferase (E2) component
MTDYTIHQFPRSRIATMDVCSVGVQKHHVSALLEIDVTSGRKKIKQYKRNKGNISFTAWLVKTIAATVHQHARSASFLQGNRKIISYHDINVSFLVEKELNGEKVPLPLLLKKVNEMNMETITECLQESKSVNVDDKDIVLQGKSTAAERMYYHLPGFLRRFAWKMMLKHPHSLFNKMGNVAITSVGMFGRVDGWFIPISIHPVCFGIGSVIKKPAVVDDKIEIREMLKMTVLIDHDVMDGAPMARFISDLTKNIERGLFL